MYDIVLVSVPYTIVETPPLGIAVLKGAVESQGYRCRTIDLGMELYKHCRQDRTEFEKVQSYFVVPNLQSDPDLAQSVTNFIDSWAFELAQIPTKWLGFSVFSYYSHLATYMLCERIKKHAPDKKIVIGGPGAFIKISDAMLSAYKISRLERSVSFSDIIRKRKLVDETIRGDGEQALIDLLSGQQLADQFHMEQYRDKDYAFANFDDFDLALYEGQRRGHPQLPIFSSKGCVRNCDFCDVNVVQSRFRFRYGENIFKEIVYLAEKYKIRNFLFLDSLVNGSLKSMREWVTLLADYNKQNPTKRISWSASGWICRPIGQIPEDFYPVLADSGLDNVSVGVESGSNRVLKAMDKKTNVEALYFEAEQFRRHGIKFIPLMMVGHWSETWEDFLQTCELMIRLAPLVKTGTLTAVDPGVPYVMLSDTPSDMNKAANNTVMRRSQLWYCFDNPSLTAKERYQRLLLLDRVLSTYNVPVQDRQLFAALCHRVRDMLPEFQEFYSEILSDAHSLPPQLSRHYLDNFDDFLCLLENRVPKDNNFNIHLEVYSEEVNGAGSLQISLNDKIVFDKKLSAGNHTINLSCAVGQLNSFAIKFYGKELYDTKVDAQGTILADKHISIKKFKIDGMDIFADPEFFYYTPSYTEHGRATKMKHGFWINDSEMRLVWPGHFVPWYCKTSKKNANFDVFLVTNAQVPATQKRDHAFDGDRQELLSLLDTMKY